MPNLYDRKLIAAVAIAALMFGVVTMIAGARTLLGADPGYVVYLPLLRFNTIMGVVYVAVGAIAWWSLRLGFYGSAAICVLNLVALGVISYLYTPNGSIASTSIQAMIFRTVVWLVLFLVLAWSRRRIVTEK